MTWWSTESGTNELLEMDLEKVCTANAVQVNFAEQDVFDRGNKVLNRHRYTIASSIDGKNWKM